MILGLLIRMLQIARNQWAVLRNVSSIQATRKQLIAELHLGSMLLRVAVCHQQLCSGVGHFLSGFHLFCRINGAGLQS